MAWLISIWNHVDHIGEEVIISTVLLRFALLVIHRL